MRPLRQRAPLLCLLSALALCAVESTASADGNFVSMFIEANGGCGEQAPLLKFDYGAGRTAPFGKAVEDWKSEDLKALKDAMIVCIPRPNGFDLNEEDQILKKMAAMIDESRQRRQDAERQAAASQQMARARAEAANRDRVDRARRREEAAGLAELRAFSAHIMSEAERDRAQRLKTTVPGLADAVDNLLRAQARLQKDAEDEQAREAERDEAARRIKAEEAQRAVQEKRAEQEAEIEADHKREAFAAALPNSCKDARRADKDLASEANRNDYARAAALAEAGDLKAACVSFAAYAAKLESVRAQLVQCTKDLDANLDDLAREEAGRSLDRAAGIYAKQKFLKQKTIEMACR